MPFVFLNCCSGFCDVTLESNHRNTLKASTEKSVVQFDSDANSVKADYDVLGTLEAYITANLLKPDYSMTFSTFRI